MRHATPLCLSLFVACAGGELSVRQEFLAQASVSVQFDTWVRSINNRNQDSLAFVYQEGPDLRVINIDGTVSRGWDEASKHWVEFFDGSDIVNLVTDVHEIEVLAEGLVLMTFRYSVDTERIDGEPGSSVSGRGSIIWTRDAADDFWKIHMQHMSARYRPEDAYR